jgi:16S rRNA (cytosine967-C5)-methyltransferase
LLKETASVLHAVVHQQRSLAELLPALTPELRPGVQALAFHTLRHWGAASSLRERLVPKRPPAAVQALLDVALALLWPGEEAPAYDTHTLVNEAVSAARQIAPAQAGLVNAVLRRFDREKENLVSEVIAHSNLARDQHPPWWRAQLEADWPGRASALLAQAQRHPPMTLRVNAVRCDAPGYLRRLAEAGIGARVPAGALTLASHALHLIQPVPVQRLPGFGQGDVSVQDLHAQFAAPLLLNALAAGGACAQPRILDACAAPGGKTAHLLEAHAGAQVLALDSDAGRLERVDETLARLGLSERARTRCANAAQPSSWWDGECFDAILLDAPCSASGIVRRHPDIRWLRRPTDIPALAQVQLGLLLALWPLLKPGGVLLYATCSVFKSEGQAVIDAFLQRPQAATARIVRGAPGHLLPGADNPSAVGPATDGDGFFYALLRRAPDG